MSKAATSPTARLLQTSRLFSLPRPLPQPINETLTSTGVYRGSDTATLPYPTHQAITTTPAALHRGDYGLKRALPAHKLRKTATPHVRINAQDTFEHITDFASAADHTQSERKWTEMGVPMVQRPKKKDESRGVPAGAPSVYEAWLDNTDPNAKAAEARQVGHGVRGRMSSSEARPMQRWKYGGPFIAGMQEGEFNGWLDRTIERRKEEWREFVRKNETDTRVARAQREAREAGEPLTPSDITRLRQELRPTDAQLPEVEKELRDAHGRDRLSSSLTALLAEFLDLPGVYQTGGEMHQKMATPDMAKFRTNFDVDSSVDDSPPTTHPAAGLSHLRTNAIMSNHPLFGPQSGPTPIQARVVRPRSSAAAPAEQYAKLGVGGFVTNDANSGTLESPSASRQRMVSEADRMAQSLDENLEGGNKMWVQTNAGYVDEMGRIRLGVHRAEPEALAVKRGGAELEAIVKAKSASTSNASALHRGPMGGRGFGL